MRERFSILCGISEHHITTEKYFNIDTYINDNLQTSNNVDIESKEIENKSSKKWQCNSNCRLDDERILRAIEALYQEIYSCNLSKMEEFFDKFNACSALDRDESKMAHPVMCHTDPFLCQSKFLKLLIVKAHFRQVQNIAADLYAVQRQIREMKYITNAIESTDQTQLQLVFEKYAHPIFSTDDIVSLNEHELRETMKAGA